MRFSRRTLAATAISIPLLKPAHSALAWRSEELAAAKSRITSLGQFVPGGDLDGMLNFNWIDPERQLFHIARDLDNDGKMNAFMQSAFGTGPELLNSLRAIESELGFGYLNIRQAISAQAQPNYIQMFQLDMDVAELPAIWEKAGYEERENEDGAFWTIGENGDFDVKNPIQRVAFASLNNIALLDDYSIAFAPTAELLGVVTATVTAEHPDILGGLNPVTEALPESAISAMYVDGAVMAYQHPEMMTEEQALKLDEMIVESDDAVGPMPVVRTACAGTTQGAAREEELHDQNSVSYMLLETESSAEEAGDVISWRHENMPSLISGEPYQDLLQEIETTVVSENVLLITSKDRADRAVFSEMLLQADNLLFAYTPEE